MYTLVLNATNEVMKIVSWKRAVMWVLLDKVDVIEEYEQYIHSISTKVKIPSVVKYKKFIHSKHRAIKFSRINVYARDNFTCGYCKKIMLRQDCTLDHIIPKSRGGPSSWYNCVACCSKCNLQKANKTLKEAGMILKIDPRQPKYSESFYLAMRLKTVTMPKTWENYTSAINNKYL